MDVAVAVVAGLLVAGVAFRRARRVRTPEARRGATTFLAAARAGVGVAALVGIAWLAAELFT